MVINNFQDFYKLIQNESVSIKFKLEGCINSASKICNCNRNLKLKKINECNTLYCNYVKSNLDVLYSIFKNKIKDKEIIFNSNSVYLTTLKLNKQKYY